MYKISNPETFRSNVRKNFESMFRDVSLSEETSSSEPMDVEKLVTNMEKGVFNYCIEEAGKRNIIKKWENPSFVSLYVDRLRSMYMNLKSNINLMESILSGELKSQELAFMTHQQFCPEKWKVLIEQKIKRDASKFMTNIQASTDVYQCRRCKSRKCVYYEQQVRSADESMTIFVTCLDCGKQWKC